MTRGGGQGEWVPSKECSEELGECRGAARGFLYRKAAVPPMGLRPAQTRALGPGFPACEGQEPPETAEGRGGGGGAGVSGPGAPSTQAPITFLVFLALTKVTEPP